MNTAEFGDGLLVKEKFETGIDFAVVISSIRVIIEMRIIRRIGWRSEKNVHSRIGGRMDPKKDKNGHNHLVLREIFPQPWELQGWALVRHSANTARLWLGEIGKAKRMDTVTDVPAVFLDNGELIIQCPPHLSSVVGEHLTSVEAFRPKPARPALALLGYDYESAWMAKYREYIRAGLTRSDAADRANVLVPPPKK